MKTIVLVALTFIACQSAVALDYEYDSAGRLVKVKYDNGTETVYTYDLNGNLIGKITDVTNSVQEQELEKLNVSPIPANETVKIEFEEGFNGKVGLTVFESTGALMLRAERFAQTGSCSLDVRHLPNGVYQLVVSYGKKQYTKSLVILR